MESLPWIESNFLVNARKWQEHDLAAESTTGPFGGLSGTTFAVEICLNFQVNRSGELDVSREQTADCNTRDCLRNLCCQFPLFLWRMLPFLTGLFFFSFIFTLHLLSQSSAVGPVLQEDCHLELLICIHAVSCLFPNLIPASVLNISSSCSSLQPSSYKKIPSCFASFSKHWELSTAAWRSLISFGSLPFSWLS